MSEFSKLTPETLYQRLLDFAKRCQKLIKLLPKNIYNIEYSAQLIRSSGSSGSDYIEAIEAISPKDFPHRLKICRKETRESTHWLILIKNANEDLSKEILDEIESLIKEADELTRIFTSSILTFEANQRNRK